MIPLVFILVSSLLLTGIINRVRARLSGRKGIRLFQHLYDVRLLLRKGSVYSTATGPVFRIAPCVTLATVLMAAAIVPLPGMRALISFDGDIVLFAYLLALGRFFLIAGALDTGSSFQGMGASRENLFGALVEPALFVTIGTLCLLTGKTSFSEIMQRSYDNSYEMVVIAALAAYVLFKVALVEASRIPVDDPRTHLELTMIHEVMELDYSGFDRALITLGGWVKTALLALIGASVLVSVLRDGAALIVLVALSFGLGIGLLESFTARNRLSRNTTYLATILALALVAFLVAYLVMRNISIE